MLSSSEYQNLLSDDESWNCDRNKMKAQGQRILSQKYSWEEGGYKPQSEYSRVP